MSLPVRILKSLCSTLNSISPTVCTATLTHHAKVIDDCASDSNHKKLLGMTTYLCHQYQEASATHHKMMESYNEKCNAAGPLGVESWTTQIKTAEAQHLDQIYHANIVQHKTESDQSPSGQLPTPGPTEAWLELALLVEEK